ncbi:MAG: L-histidine N(alpha)-methyltransferase [Legionella sp.]|nr:L-histidine N(alpha)-methyltransferase [Legionella sp.]
MNQFESDVKVGLTATPKKISSKYLYDEKGSELYNLITRHPEYYLTGCELEIIENNKAELTHLIKDEAFNLIELGPGEGIKSFILLKQLLKESKNVTYFIIDISRKYIDYLSTRFLTLLPDLKISPIYEEFNEGLHQLKLHSKTKNLVLFLGSSIGNFNVKETIHFLKSIHEDLNTGDYLLIGFDLRKDINLLYKAYQDSDGLTSEFNLNLLTRMNKELKTNFKMNQFKHHAFYNDTTHAMESYLISLKQQEVYSKVMNQTFYFDENEPIQLECSFKYTLSQIQQFAEDTDFNLIKNFEDSKKYFILSLWQVRQ